MPYIEIAAIVVDVPCHIFKYREFDTRYGKTKGRKEEEEGENEDVVVEVVVDVPCHTLK